MNLRDISTKITQNKLNNMPILIGIDGCGGAGKSTFAKKLKNELDQDRVVSIIQMDDFYLPSSSRDEMKDLDLIGGSFDWRRLLEQVIKPISSGIEGYYQKYDWNQDMLLEEWHKVSLGVVIVEGVYCLRSELFDYYDYSVWIETDYNTRLARGIERDGENMRDMWADVWMPAEHKYRELERPYEKANLVIDGTVEEELNV